MEFPVGEAMIGRVVNFIRQPVRRYGGEIHYN